MSSESSLNIVALTTEKLLTVFRHGDSPYSSAQAFHHLYDTTHVSIFRYIYALYNGSVEEVEDLTADTYEKAWKARHRFRGDDDAAMGWLVTIARNVTIDQQRKQRRSPMINSLETVETLSSPHPEVDQQAILYERQRQLLSIMEQLPVQEREILTATSCRRPV